MANDANVSSISKSRSIEEMADFWDTHDAMDYEDRTHEVDMVFDIRARSHYIAVDPTLLARLRKVAHARGLSTESLANLWLQERILAQEG